MKYTNTCIIHKIQVGNIHVLRSPNRPGFAMDSPGRSETSEINPPKGEDNLTLESSQKILENEMKKGPQMYCE